MRLLQRAPRSVEFLDPAYGYEAPPAAADALAGVSISPYPRGGMFIAGSKAVSYSRAWGRFPRMNPIETEQENLMSDDKSKSQGQDRERINVHQEYELRDWAKSLKTTPERLKEAVQAVGDRADKVREYLGERDKSGS